MFDLWDVSRPFWAAWDVLNLSRPHAVGMSGAVPLPIPYVAVSQYARDVGISPGTFRFEAFVQLVYAQDSDHLTRENERRSAK